MLKILREQLLQLHKALLDHQKVGYEAKHGLISNPNLYYQLVISHESFAWLKTLSALIVSIDELLESKDGVPEEKAKQIITYTQKLLTEQSGTSVFSTNYQTAVQNNPEVSTLHVQALSTLNS